jgi:hypothetical protein
VVGELRKQASWAGHPVSLFHYRTTTGREVDIILENQQGQLVGLEIKASQTISKKDFAGLETLAEDTGTEKGSGVFFGLRPDMPSPPRNSCPFTINQGPGISLCEFQTNIAASTKHWKDRLQTSSSSR